jgi:hypothetical protein
MERNFSYLLGAILYSIAKYPTHRSSHNSYFCYIEAMSKLHAYFMSPFRNRPTFSLLPEDEVLTAGQ